MVISSRFLVEPYMVSMMRALSCEVENVHQRTLDLLHVEREGSSRHVYLVLG